MTNLIQNYAASIINQRNLQSPQVVQNNPAIAALKTNVKPLESKGYLVKESAFQSAKYAVKKPFEEFKFFRAAIKGEGNDYSVGRINDLGTKLGSLGIAGILAASAGSPFKKGMEFVGLISWFAAMSVWPKIVGFGVKQKAGFDPNQQYVDSYGRRKPFFQDAQYICWDLMNKDELNKIGDKLKIPKDIKNREEAIKSKMQQIATQNNTLAMLTAGFATPIISSLVSDQASKLVDPMMEKAAVKKALMKIEKAEKHIEVNQTLLDSITQTLKNKAQINADEKRKLFEKFDEAFGSTDIKVAVDKELEKLLTGKEVFEVTGELKGKIAEVARVPKEQIEEILNKMGTQKLDNYDFESFISELFRDNKAFDIDFEQLAKAENKAIFVQNARKAAAKSQEEALSSLRQLFTQNKVTSMGEGVVDNVQNLYKVANNYKVKSGILNKFLVATLRDTDGSATANTWKYSSEKLVKALNLSDEDVKILADQKTTKAVAERIIDNAMLNIHENDQKMSKTLDSLSKIFDSAVQKDKKYSDEAFSYLQRMNDEIITAADEMGFKELTDSMSKGISIEKKNVLNKVVNTKTSFSKPIKVLNIYQKLSEQSDADIKDLQKLLNVKNREELVEMIKKIVFDKETASNFINKFEEFDNMKPQSKKAFMKLMDVLFPALDDKIKAAVPEHVAKEIDGNNALVKTLFETMENSVKLDKNVSYAETLWNVKKLYFDNYIDGYLPIKVDASKLEQIKNILKKDNNFEDLLVLLKMEVKNQAELLENPEKLKEFLEISGKNIINSISSLPEYDTVKRRLSELSEGGFFKLVKQSSNVEDCTMAAGKGFADLVRKAANDTVSYKTWLKRAGVMSAALVGATAIGIALMGRKNKFNPDIYEKKEDK